MAEKFKDRLSHAWDVFRNKSDLDSEFQWNLGRSYSTRPDRVKMQVTTERSLVISLYNRIAIDVAGVSIQHVRVDENKRYLETIDSGINRVFNLSANEDQTGRAFVQDFVMSMFDEGCVAIVPTNTDFNPALTNSYDIHKMRVGKIVQWFPKHIRVCIFDEVRGEKIERTVEKKYTAIIENPFYSIINEPNSTLKRLVRKLALIDGIDEAAGSGKLDLLVQLPYTVRNERQANYAETRRAAIEDQMKGSKYGIAYIDGTERVIQLNRPAENNLMAQIEYLTQMLYSQLGLSKEIFDGTASEEQMLNYYNKMVEPILSCIVDEMNRKFLTATARTQGQAFMFFRDHFELVPVSKISEISDKLTRNEILSSNEVRSILGFKPVATERAEELSNKNLKVPGASTSQPENQNGSNPGNSAMQAEQDAIMDELFSGIESDIDSIIGGSNESS